MSKTHIEIIVPKESVSDDSYKITHLFFKNGSAIKANDLLAELETSKANFDIEAPESGFIFFVKNKGQQIEAGALLAIISSDKNFDIASVSPITPITAPLEENKEISDDTSKKQRISQEAQKLIQINNILPQQLPAKSLIRAEDIEEILNKKPKLVFSTNSVVIIGGGGHTKVCIDLLRQSQYFQIAGVVYTKFAQSKTLLDIPVLGGIEELPDFYEQGLRNVVLGVGGLDNPNERLDLYKRVTEMGFFVPTLVHTKAIIEPSAKIEAGCQIMAGAIIGSDVLVQENTIINSNSVISHDCIIGKHSHIAPSATLAGNVHVGNNTLIGMGVTALWRAKIGNRVIINNGCHITKNISDNSVIKNDA